tara:strand:- start:346 stop:831 length:486 start_codon:yes stop_codon:yes gene_type:complete
MDILLVLNSLRPGESITFNEGSNEDLSNVIWINQTTYTSDQDVSNINVTWNEESNVYTETPFSIPTQQECEDYWTTTLQNELTLKSLRRKRDTLLTQTDKYVIPDWPHASVESANAWVTYRQALRDLPSVTEDPANPVWPARPDEVVAVVVEEETSNVVVE